MTCSGHLEQTGVWGPLETAQVLGKAALGMPVDRATYQPSAAARKATAPGSDITGGRDFFFERAALCAEDQIGSLRRTDNELASSTDWQSPFGHSPAFLSVSEDPHQSERYCNDEILHQSHTWPVR